MLAAPAAAGMLIVLDRPLDDGLGGSPDGWVVNFWQLNLQAIRAERCHQFALRPNASA